MTDTSAGLKTGNFGAAKSLGDGVFELRLDFGPGYRVYYALEKKTLILLLTGGDKSSQNKDIALARKYWQDHKRRKKDG